MNNLKCAIYVRVSKSNGSQDTENQAVILRDYCDRQGWEITEYADYISGKTSDREGFNRLFEDARHKRFDIVLFWALDRFSREGALKTLTLLQELTKCGVAWKSYTEQYLDSLGPFSDAIIAIIATLAKQERIRISERTQAGLAQARLKGKQIGRPRRIVDVEAIEAAIKSEGSWRKAANKLGLPVSTLHSRLRSAKVQALHSILTPDIKDLAPSE